MDSNLDGLETHYYLVAIRSARGGATVVTVKADGQVDRELHHEHGCSSAFRRGLPPDGARRRDDSITDNVETTRSQSGGVAEAR